MAYAAVMLALLVVNPQATSTTPAGRDVLAHALASDVKLEVVETTYRGHAADAAAQAAADGYDLVVAHGGDGTVNEVVNGLLSTADGSAISTAPMLGVVPGGSANVFARALGLPRDPMEAAHQLLQAIEFGRSRRIGLGKADARWFTFNAGIGWDAAVVSAVAGRRSKQASPALYTRTALTRYLKQARRPPNLTVCLPDAPPVSGVRVALVCNTDRWTYLGSKPLRLLPNTAFDRGLGLFALRSLAAPVVLNHLTQVFRDEPEPHGRHLVRRDDVSHIRVISETDFPLQVDGDLVGEQKSVDFTAVPDALRVVV